MGRDLGGVVISASELLAIAHESWLVVADCRFSLGDPDAGQRAYAAGHLPGAVYAHLERDLSGPVVTGKTGRHPLPDPRVLASKLSSWGLGREGALVAYDDSGGAFAARLWWLLRWLGFESAAVLDGGLPAWLSSGLPVVTEFPATRQGDFALQLRPELVVGADQVERARTRADRRVFDARGLERFRGDSEPIDPVAGHIPGARPLPYGGNLESGRFREVSSLRERYGAALGAVAPEHSIVYCGSGVTACHDVLAAAHAGFGGMRLYAGSWSEWITDPERLTARGD